MSRQEEAEGGLEMKCQGMVAGPRASTVVAGLGKKEGMKQVTDIGLGYLDNPISGLSHWRDDVGHRAGWVND